jgi:flagellar motor protein MotB
MENNTVFEEDGQSYLVSVSDMMAGLLFLFIITLMVFVINFHLEKIKTEEKTKDLQIEKIKKEQETKALQIEKIKKEQETKVLQSIQEELTDAKEVRKHLLEDLEKSLKKHGVIVRIDTEKGLLHVPEDILFESGKAEIQKGGKKSLSILAHHLSEKLPCYSGKRGVERPESCEGEIFKPGRLEVVLVEGHTDNVPIGTSKFDNNWDLSAKRSIVTFIYLKKVQPELDRLINADDVPLFGVSGYADTRPVKHHDEINPEPLNRRIDLRFILAPPRPESIRDLVSNN